jgi:inner membrane protein
MPSSWTHAIAAVTVAAALAPKDTPARVWAVVAVSAVIPDIDAIGRPFGRGDVDFLGGHRALTHSFTFAAALSVLLVAAALRSVAGFRARVTLWLALALAIASHGLLDTLVTYGEGVQFFAPWSEQRYAAPWRPLGGGLFRDTLLFLLCFFTARIVIVKRGFVLPRALNPRFLQPAA